MDEPDIITVHIPPGQRLFVGRYMTVETWAPETGMHCCTYDHETETWDPEPPPATFGLARTSP